MYVIFNIDYMLHLLNKLKILNFACDGKIYIKV